MRRSATLALLGASLLVACGPPGSPVLEISCDTAQLENDGTVATIQVSATEANGNPGTGWVTLVVDRGAFVGASQNAALQLQDGLASARYACNAGIDRTCTGGARFTGSWSERTSILVVPLVAP